MGQVAVMAQIPLKRVETGSEIPRVIHMVYPRLDLPEELAENVRRVREVNHDWSVRLYDDGAIEEYIDRHYGREIAAIYSCIDPAYGAARADLFRYLLVYNEGGCYLDIKSQTTRPLSEVLGSGDQYLLAQWDNGPAGKYPDFGLYRHLAHIDGGEFQQWHIISVKGHPFLRAVISAVMGNIASYRPWREGVGRPGVVRLTGPVAYTLAIEAVRQQHPYRMVEAERDLGLEYSAVRSSGGHYKFFSRHYSELDHPIVAQSLMGKSVWLLFRRATPLVRQLVNPLRKIRKPASRKHLV
jgi:inositol phosphorylceramide mannosyltransferase catalytic subunit